MRNILYIFLFNKKNNSITHNLERSRHCHQQKKQNHTAEYISINQKNIKTSSSVELLGVHIDDKLNFNLHISKICRSAANQLHALIRLQMFLNFEEKKTLINSYFYSSFNYCPLVWMFSSAKSLNKVESLQKRALRFLYEDYVSSYEELLQKAGKETMKVNRLRSLCIEIYKSINNLIRAFKNIKKTGIVFLVCQYH